MAGVKAQAEPSIAAAGVQERLQLLERAPERAAGAGRVLEQEIAPLGAPERFPDHLARAADRLGDIPMLGRPGMKYDSDRSDPCADVQRLLE